MSEVFGKIATVITENLCAKYFRKKINKILKYFSLRDKKEGTLSDSKLSDSETQTT